MGLPETIAEQVEKERLTREAEALDEWFVEELTSDERAPDTYRSPPWWLDLPLQPETDLPSVMVQE